MKIYDRSQEIFACQVFPGDPSPKREVLSSTAKGDLYNLTAFSMCAHNGTHIDAPFHFINDGKTVEKICMERYVGFCLVAEYDGVLNGKDAEEILKKASRDAKKRILLKGDATVSLDAAKFFKDSGIYLLGNESQTVGPEKAPMEVHKELLSADVVLLEGIRLLEVPEGEYLLCAAPLCLEGADGAPCRAVLIDLDM